MGAYIEKNMQSMMDLQTQLVEQSKTHSPEVWKQFVGAQSPAMQALMGTYVEQSQHLFAHMQEQMLGAMGLKR